MKKTIGTNLNQEAKEAFERTAHKNMLSQSDIVNNALYYYIWHNPDNLKLEIGDKTKLINELEPEQE